MKFSAVVIISFFSSAAFAQGAELDSTFGGNGIVTTYDYSGFSFIHSIALQPDGKIVAVGDLDCIGPCNGYVLKRYNSDGTLDYGLGSGGGVWDLLFWNDFPKYYSLAIQQDGKIIVGDDNPSDNKISRYNSDGSYDIKLNANWNTQDLSYRALAIQSDGKILVAGDSTVWPYSILSIARCDTSGTLDYNFGIDGVRTTSIETSSSAYCVAIQQDGKIVIGGSVVSGTDSNFVLCRYDLNGDLDNTFGNGGIIITDVGPNSYGVSSLGFQSDGKIIAAGGSGYYPNGHFYLIRFNTDGIVDNSFGLNGIMTSTMGGRMAIQNNDQIIVAGGYRLVRYNKDGNLDNNFGSSGVVITSILVSSVALQTDGKIVVGGWNSDGEFALARYLPGLNVGIISFSSSQSSPLIYPNPVHQTETLEYTLTKNESLTIALYDVNGKLVKNFIMNEQRTAGEHKEVLNMGDIPAGNYFLTLSNGSQMMSVKMVKQ